MLREVGPSREVDERIAQIKRSNEQRLDTEKSILSSLLLLADKQGLSLTSVDSLNSVIVDDLRITARIRAKLTYLDKVNTSLKCPAQDLDAALYLLSNLTNLDDWEASDGGSGTLEELAPNFLKCISNSKKLLFCLNRWNPDSVTDDLASSREVCTQLKSAVTTLQVEIDKLNDYLNRRVGELETLMDTNDREKRLIQDEENSLAKSSVEGTDVTEELFKVERNLVELSEKLQISEGKIKVMRVFKTELEGKLLELKSSSEQLRSTENFLRVQLEERQSKRQKNETFLADYKNRESELLGKIESNKEELNIVKHNLQDIDRQIERNKAEFSMRSKRSKDVQCEITRKLSRISTLEREISNSTANIAKYQLLLKDLQDESAEIQENNKYLELLSRERKRV